MPVPFAVIGFTLFFVLAIFFEASTETTVTMLIIFIAALLVSIAVEVLRKNKVIPVALATGAAAFILLILFNKFIYAPQMTFDGNIYNIRAELTDYPEQNYGKFYYPATVISANGKDVKIKTRILLKSPAEAEPYDIIEGNFKFYRLGRTSEKILASYKASGTYLGAYSVDEGYKVIYPEKSEKPFMSRVSNLRASIRKSVYRILPNEYGSLAIALILGDDSGLSGETLASFRNAGISHLICVSGLHLSIWGLLILKILRKIGIGQRLSAGLTIIPVVFLMLITGLNYSIVRSGIMMLVFLLSDILLRQRDSLNSLGFSLAVMAVANPFSMGAIGLQLSALSSLGIILCSRYILPDLKEKTEKIKYFKKPLYTAVNALLITCSAVAFTLPVLAEINYGFNFAVFPTNLLTVWAAGYAMVLSAIGALVGFIPFSIFNLPGFLGGLLCKYIIKASEFINHFNSLNLRISAEKLYISMLAAMVFAVMAFVISRGNRKFKAFSVLLCGAVFIVSMLVSSNFENNEMRATAIDVGNGTSVLITYRGENILVGCNGTDDMTETKIGDAVRDNGGSVDAFILCGEEDEISEMISRDYLAQTNSDTDEIRTETVKSNGGYAVFAETKEGAMLIVSSPSVDLKELPQKFFEADILFTRSDLPKNYDKDCFEFAVITADKVRGELIEKYLANGGIKCVSTRGFGNVSVRCRDNYYSYERN